MSEMIEFSFGENKCMHKIKVLGIGGAGNNAINNMLNSGLTGPVFIAANSDLQDLERCQAAHKIQVGAQLTKGLGCGGKSDVGRAAALEDIDKLKDALADSDMVFITAGMGGGTGSGGAPVVAEALSKLNNPPLVVGVVTKPFPFEGSRRMRQAEASIKDLIEFTDTIITVPNDKLLSVVPRGGGFKDALRMADDVLLQAVKGISDLITKSGYMNVDFQDVKTIMSKRGPAIMGTGQASGEDRAVKAAELAVSSPLLNDISIKGARGLLINISCPEDNIRLEEIAEAAGRIQREAHEDAEVIVGVAFDNTLSQDESVRVTVIATGLGVEEEMRPVMAADAALAPKEAPGAGSAETAVPQSPPSLAAAAGQAAKVTHIDDVIRHNKELDRPAYERRGGAATLGELNKRPKSATRYEMYNSFDEDILDTPTFMRIKAD